MSSNTAVVTGLPEMLKAFNDAPKFVLTFLKTSNLTTAQLIRARARMAVRKRSGDLEKAIDFTGKGMELRVGIVDADVESRGGRNSAHRNPSVYGAWSEFGRKGQKAHPFLRPAADGQRADHSNRTIQAVRAAIARLSSRANPNAGGRFL